MEEGSNKRKSISMYVALVIGIAAVALFTVWSLIDKVISLVFNGT